MYLYDKKDKTIDVYSFDANEIVMKAYRETQMQQIPENKRVYIAESYSPELSTTPILALSEKELDQRIFSMEEANSRQDNGNYHLLSSDKTSRRNREILLDSFYYGHLSNRNVARIHDLEQIRYFLLEQTTYIPELYNRRIRTLKNIIELPESLYLLQMLEQGKFSPISNHDFSEQLELFSVAHIDEISLEELAKMDVCGITENAYESTLNKTTEHAPVIQLCKKQGKIPH